MQALAPVSRRPDERANPGVGDEPPRPEDGQLWKIVQRYLDENERSEAWLSQKIDAAPQTVSAWKRRGLRELPATHLLRNLARLTGTPYLQVLTAALLDIGRVDEAEADELTRSIRYGRPD